MCVYNDNTGGTNVIDLNGYETKLDELYDLRAELQAEIDDLTAEIEHLEAEMNSIEQNELHRDLAKDRI
jgi:prefoldin subunit 5